MTAEGLNPEHEAISKAWTVRIAEIINKVAVSNTVEVSEDE